MRWIGKIVQLPFAHSQFGCFTAAPVLEGWGVITLNISCVSILRISISKWKMHILNSVRKPPEPVGFGIVLSFPVQQINLACGLKFFG